jgi:hypothetical protein
MHGLSETLQNGSGYKRSITPALSATRKLPENRGKEASLWTTCLSYPLWRLATGVVSRLQAGGRNPHLAKLSCDI